MEAPNFCRAAVEAGMPENWCSTFYSSTGTGSWSNARLQRLHTATALGWRKAIVPSIPSFTVFVSSISEAIEQILRSRVEPGTYTMISDPAWSYKELLEWLAQDAGVEVSVAVEPSTTSRLGMLARLKSFIGNTAVYHKEYLAEIAMRYAPVYFERYRQNHRAKISGAQILEFEAILCKQYFSQKVSIPGQRIACLSDSRQSMPLKHRGLKKMIAQLTE